MSLSTFIIPFIIFISFISLQPKKPFLHSLRKHKSPPDAQNIGKSISKTHIRRMAIDEFYIVGGGMAGILCAYFL